MDEIRQLIDELNKATKAYDEGNSIMTDAEWDEKYFQLQNLENTQHIYYVDSPTQHIDYKIVNELEKVKHNHPMLSLDKTKNEEDVASFLNNKNGIAMAKMDGLTCSIHYIDGQIIRAETRGDGIIGEDITHNIYYVKGVPNNIPIQDDFIVDGEIICTYEDFKDFANEYKNPRNFASGSIRLLDSRVSARRKLTFVAWDCIKGLEEYETLSEKLSKLGNLGFIFTPFLPIPANITDINHAITLIKNWSKDEGYPIDGIVFKYNNCAYYQSLGETNHHPRGGLAFKFYDDIYETYLKNIEWSMGRTGVLTPIAVFYPVEIDGTIIERASLHNVSIMKQLLPHGLASVGQIAGVFKANMIIPQIQYIKDNPNCMGADILTHPLICPICSEPVKLVKSNNTENYYCSNPNCEGKFLNQLEHFCGKKGLDIKGLSKATLQKLIDWGWVGNYIELFSLSNFRNEWIKQPGFGEKSVDNLLNAIEEKRNNTELWQFISALGIPNIGTTYGKVMARQEYDWHNIREDIEGGYDFTQWNGFGYEINDAIHNFDYTEADELAKIITIKNSLWTEKDNPSTIKKLDGMTIVITGSLHHFKNRDALKDKIEQLGGKVASSISSKTNYLINNDFNSTSSKNKSAMKLNIPIITEDDFISRFLTE